MKNYRKNAATETRIDYGIELIEGLKAFPETAPFAPDFEQLQDEVQQAYDTRKTVYRPLQKARVALRLANYFTDQGIRACSRAAESAGGSGGPVSKALFPHGVGPVVAPIGARQVKPTGDLLDRLVKSKHPAVIAFAAEWQPKVQDLYTKISTAATAHLTARKAHDSAFADEVALRDEHRRQVDRLMGLVRATFPGDRAKQDVVFPPADEDSAPAAEEPETPPESTETPA